MKNNAYIPFRATIKEIIAHTNIEYTFRVEYKGNVKPGQFFEISLPKYGEAPISVSGITAECIDFTIRKVGKVTDEIFKYIVGDSLFLRGPYGNGFNVDVYKNKELVVVAGGTGVSSVRGVIEYFSNHPKARKEMTLIAGFKSPDDILFKDDFNRWKDTMNVVLTVDDAAGDTTYQTGLVTTYIPKLKLTNIKESVAIVVGPPVMMNATVKVLLAFGFEEQNIWISHERKMCCGIGKCGHCRINDKYVCLDGPVFNYLIGKNLVD